MCKIFHWRLKQLEDLVQSDDTGLVLHHLLCITNKTKHSLKPNDPHLSDHLDRGLIFPITCHAKTMDTTVHSNDTGLALHRRHKAAFSGVINDIAKIYK